MLYYYHTEYEVSESQKSKVTKMDKTKQLGTPVYLRDLQEDCQNDLREKIPILLQVAEAEGRDIIVGYYLRVEQFEVSE